MCSICDLRIEFSVEHPLSLSVAVNTRQAIDAGILQEPDFPDDEFLLRERAIGALRAAQQRLEWSLRPEELLAVPDFFVLLIESRTWGFCRPMGSGSGFDPNCSPSPPNITAEDICERDAVLVASESSISALAVGQVPFATALADGIIALDADPERFGVISGMWSKAYPELAFSRFVCA